MTDVHTRTRATRTSAPDTLARAAVATVLALAAPAVSFLPALTTNIHGSGAAVTFPHGYAITLVVTVVVTVVACAAGALIAGRGARGHLDRAGSVGGHRPRRDFRRCRARPHSSDRVGNRAHGSCPGWGGRRAPHRRAAMTTGPRSSPSQHSTSIARSLSPGKSSTQTAQAAMCGTDNQHRIAVRIVLLCNSPAAARS